MFALLPMALLLAFAVPTAEQAASTQATAIAPFLGEEVAVVVHIDLTKWDAQTFFRRVLGKLVDEDDLNADTKAIDSSVAALKAAGAKDLFLLFEPADIPGLPTAVVPLVDGGDDRAIATALSGGVRSNPFRWPATETIRGSVVAGTPAGLARIRNAEPKARPELLAAMAAGGDTSIQIAIVPSTTLRRSIEESLAVLPQELGGGPITTVSQGLRWISVTLAFEPKPVIRAVVQTKDPDAAKALLNLVTGRPRSPGDCESKRSGADLVGTDDQPDQASGEGRPDHARGRPGDDGRAGGLADPSGARGGPTLPMYKQPQADRPGHSHLPPRVWHFPSAYSKSPDGKPLLSWRVHILPFLGQKALYDEFHKDEPWDSEHNKTLISRMPAVYTCPSGSRTPAKEGKTTYLTPRGPSTIFPGARAIEIRDITDGTSNTILVVDASDAAAVTWTKPDDWDISVELKVQSLFGHHPKGTNFGFADGSVHFLKETVTPKVLHNLTTRNGGEIIDWDDL